MAGVELLVSAFVPLLLERLTSPEVLQFLREEGLSSKIKKWEETLKLIQAVLGDAEEKQLKERAVKAWLDDLRDLAYDVEDILDEFTTEAFANKLKIEQQHDPEVSSTSKIRKSVSTFFGKMSPSTIKFSSRIGSEIKHVSSRFQRLCKLRESLGLKENNAGVGSSNSAPRRTPSSSVQTEPAVYGRDGDKAKILEMVLNDEPSDANFRVIPIVGMGGVGKTTLAREVYNDKMVQSFELKAWVCVSDDHDVLKISNAILEYITRSPSGLKELSTVQYELKEKVNGRKFLIVLDDVWRMNYGQWETLKSPFMAGAQGSRMIVTTRLQDVALTFRPSGFYPLDLLPYEVCWLVFSMHAFESGDISTHPKKELIRQKVIEMSKGLPLAARSLGGLLRSKKKDDWLEILNTEIWDLSKDGENEVPTALKLSYHHLPSHLKRCFAYCAILPKDYEFEEEELVLLWMAEGLIQQSTKHKQPEEFGGEYFYDLLSRSIFQQSSSNRSKFTMHDLVHDLAQWAFGEIILRLDDVMGADKKPKGSDKVRYFSYTANFLEGTKKFEVLDEGESLRSRIRTFLPIFRKDYRECYITDIIISDLVPKLKRLRALSLRTYYITELPTSVEGLIHLRYLNLSATKIKSLPESTGLLYNLQILMLRDCSRLSKLPSSFRYLINLRHLDIKGAILIKEMPLGMKELESLQKLSNFIVGIKDAGSAIKDLKSLKFLRGELCISGLDNVVDCNPRDLILRDTEDLKELLLEWGSQFDESRNEVVEKNVLDMLWPHQHLEKLTIKCYGGKRFPSWVGDSSFSNMTVLRLQSCVNCTFMPSFGLLGSLKDLTIKGMKGLKHIGYEIYGEGYLKPFQSLKILCFEDMLQWENWEPVKENEYVYAFPCLQELSVVNCPKLSGRLPNSLPSLEKLVIKNCKQLVVSYSSFPVLRKLEIDGCKGLSCNSPTDSKSLKFMTLADISEFGNWLWQHNFLKVECQKLTIMGCEQLKNLWQLNETFLEKPPQAQGLQSFFSITELRIENCFNLVSFAEVCFLSNLGELEIINCNALTHLPKGMNDKNACLGSLKIKDCNSLTFIVRGQLPSYLKRLEIESCKKLEYLWDDRDESCTSVVDEENSNNTRTSLLKYLQVKKCPSLKCLSSSGQLPNTLRTISLYSLPELESIAKSFHNTRSLEEMCIISCKNLKSISEGLHNLSHLRRIVIDGCESIDCFAEEGLPNTNLSELTIKYCKKLKALPNRFHSVKSLKSLTLCGCQSMRGFPEEGFPTSLTSLKITDVKINKPLLEWGLHNLTSLTYLSICGVPGAESFPQQEKEMTFPPSLTHLSIYRFPNLKCLMGVGFRNLNSLEKLSINYIPNLTSFPELSLPSSLSTLWIWNCPEVRSFPEQGLPSSLLNLDIRKCPKLKEECKRDKGKEWSKISRIPCVKIDWKFVYDLEEEE